MPWKKESDTAAHHSMVTAPMAMVDQVGWPAQLTEHDFANLVWGIVSRAATLSAALSTDYVVKAGDLINIAGANWRHWVGIAERVGFLTPAEPDEGGQAAWLLVDDANNLFHIRRKAEMEWESDRKKDTSSPLLFVPVRLRDGDGCRYCGCIVTWGDQKATRGGTYDHRVPGRRAEGPDDLRVACRTCNSTRLNRADADEALPPLPAPMQPFYGEKTVALLKKHGHKVPRSSTRRHRAVSQEAVQCDTASGGTPRPHHAPRAPEASPATPQPAGPREPERPGSRPDHATETRSIREQPARSQPQAPNSDTEIPALSSANSRLPNDCAIHPIAALRNPETPGRDGLGSGARPVPSTARRRSRRGRPPPPQPPPRKDHRGQGD